MTGRGVLQIKSTPGCCGKAVNKNAGDTRCSKMSVNKITLQFQLYETGTTSVGAGHAHAAIGAAIDDSGKTG